MGYPGQQLGSHGVPNNRVYDYRPDIISAPDIDFERPVADREIARSEQDAAAIARF